MSKSPSRSVRHHGLGFLPLFSGAMRPLPKDGAGRAFSFAAVLWRVALIAVLSLADLAVQAWWTVWDRNGSFDPWWVGLLGWSSYDFDVRGVIAAVFGLSYIPGFVLFVIGLFAGRARWVFLTSLVLLVGGVSRALGGGLGKAILYMQVADGLIDADTVRSGTNVVDLTTSGMVAGAWPVVVAAAVFAAVSLAFALLPRRTDRPAPRALIGGRAAIVVGLLGVTLVECGFMPITLVLLAVAVFVAFLWLPGEVRVARACEQDRVGAQWQWHAAGLIWLETLAVFAVIVVAALGI